LGSQSRSISLHNLAQQKAQRRDTLAATQAQKDTAKAQREQKKQDEAAELESKHVLCETMCACGIVPCEVAKVKCCPTCRTIAESDRDAGRCYALLRVRPWRLRQRLAQPLLQQRPRLS
ncbi:hypothetical protein T492DRAFT_1048265, partial [Pavlovales sp. CCMP2436]